MSEAPKPRSRLLDPWVIGAFLAMALLTFTRPCFVREPVPTPAGAAVPAFELVDQQGRPYGSSQLAGKTWVATLLPSEPGDKSERALAGLLRLQEAWEGFGPELQLVAVAVGPGPQPPQTLKELASERGADFTRLKFLSGDADSTCGAASAFAEGAGAPPCDRLVELAQRGRLLLVDGQGRSRGLYRSDALGVEEVHFRALSVAGGK